MWIRTLILVTLAILAFGQAVKNGNGERIEDTVLMCKNTRADIVFIIDGSRSNVPQIFYKQIEFLKSFVGYFIIGNDCVRFGAVTFGDKIITDNTFGLTQYTSKDQLKGRLSKIDYRPEDGGSTQTHLAIEYAREILFKDARPYAKKIAIVITDGRSTEPKKTVREALIMRKNGILILAVGVGQEASKKELLTITGREVYVFKVKGFYSLLKTVQDELSCNGNVDINFVFDFSRMGYEDSHDINTFISSSISDEYLAKKKFKFGLITGKCQRLKDFYFNTYGNKSEIIEHLNIYKTTMASLLEKALKVSFEVEYGARQGARKVAVIFLKGRLSNPERVMTNARALRKSGIEVFIVKMDKLNSDKILATITEEGNILDATSAENMVQVSGEFLNQLCKR
ncbi:Hypothetical predicted protein [Octopus vulgaris]|uniref:VWFA domain-containing protein n=1 Tax=Octopus vulgaris TaxID=6645 RepID=A0AA36BUM7_OCTVU|nr:Hypothetical predicted protein [Octopus vulgaris]